MLHATRRGTLLLRGCRSRRCPPPAPPETGAAPSPCCPMPATPCGPRGQLPAPFFVRVALASCSLPSHQKTRGCWSYKIAPACAAFPPTHSFATAPARSGILPRCPPFAPPVPGTAAASPATAAGASQSLQRCHLPPDAPAPPAVAV